MDGPFYRSSWGSSPRYPANFRATPPRKPKVVSIPVHFVQPESENRCKPRSRADCAVRIQKVWRGFRVRKNVRKILAISRELDGVDRSILERETVDAIRRNEKERLKVSEGLMSLLLRLDSVGGFDGAVRELRRSVTRRAIMLQEKVDSIVAGADNNSNEEPPKTECENQQSEEEIDSRSCEDAEGNGDRQGLQPDPETEEPYPDPKTCEASPSTIEAKSEGNPVEKREAETGDLPELRPDPETEEPYPDPETCEVSPSEIEAKSEGNPVEKREEETGDLPELQPDPETQEPYPDPETREVSPSAIEAKSEANPVEKREEETRDLQPDLAAKPECETEASPCESRGDLDSEVEEREIGVVQEVKSSGIEGGKRSREVLEKMVEENSKLMALMADLYQKNEMQTQILSSLSQRVEQLENAFACEKIRRAKKVKKVKHSQCFGRKGN